MFVIPAILLVEPDQATRRAMAATLEAAGLNVARTADGAEAVRRFRALQPRVVLLNDTLPDQTTPEVLAALESDTARNRACVAILSPGPVTPHQLTSALEAGADDCIERPSTPDALLARVRTYLRRHERLDAAQLDSEWRFRELAENIDEVFFNHDVTRDRLLYINAAYERIWARPLATVYENPRTYLDAVHPDDRAVTEEIDRRQRAGEETTSVYRIVRPDGEVRCISEHARPIVGLDGRVERIVGTARDITSHMHHERRQAWEARVLEAISTRQPLQAILEQIARGAEEFTPRALASILLLDEDGRCLRDGAAPSLPEPYRRAIDGALVGPAAGSCGTAAYRRELVVVTDIEHDPLWAEWRDVALEHGLRACWSMPVRDADGRVRATFAHYYREPRAPRAEDLRLIAAMAHLANIAIEHDRKDRALRMQAALLDKAQDAIIVGDLEHRVTYWNKSAERLYGWSSAEADRKPLRALVGMDESAFANAVAATLDQGEWTGVLDTRTRDDLAIEVQSRWTLIRDDRGAPSSILIIDTDITERRRIEAQFLRAQRLESLGRLAGGIAHDLNNVLAPIHLGATLLQSRVSADPEASDILATVQRSAATGTQLVQQILSFSRGRVGNRTELAVAPLVDEVSAIVAPSFPPGIELACDVPPDLEPTLGDVTQISQVLLNLSVNARDAMPNGGQLTIRARNVDVAEGRTILGRPIQPGRYLVIEVRDTGAGMSRRVLDRIFEPFFTTKSDTHGTGLGLPTVLGIVQGHGGFVDVDSSVGRGSTFRVHLPTAAMAGTTGDRALQRQPGTGELILIVDSERTAIAGTQRELEASGYRTLTATNGAQGFTLFATMQNDISLVVANPRVPVMEGMSFMAAVRRVAPAMAIVATDDGDASCRDNATCLLEKPHTPEALLAAVRQALAARHA